MKTRNGTPIRRRCWPCNVVWQWPYEGLPLHRARCPTCLGELRVTSHKWTGQITPLEHQP